MSEDSCQEQSKDEQVHTGTALPRGTAPAGDRRGPDHRRVLGPQAADQRRGPDPALPPLARGTRLDRQLREGRLRRAVRARRTRVLRLRGLQARRGHGLGDRPHRLARAGGGVRPPHRADGRRPGTGRLPQHPLRAPRAGTSLLQPGMGPRAVLLRAPPPGRRRAPAHPRRGRLRPDRPQGRRPRLRRVRARRPRTPRRPRRDRGRAGGVRPRHRRAAVPRPGEGLHRPIRPGHPRPGRSRAGVLPGRRAGARGRGAARPRGPRALPRLGRDRRRGGDRRRRAARSRPPPMGPDPRQAHPPHRGHGLALQRRGLRGGLLALAGPGLRRVVRRRRRGDDGVAAAPGDG